MFYACSRIYCLNMTFLCYNLKFPSILFILLDNALLYDLPFNVGSNLFTGLDALDDHLKYDPSVDIFYITYIYDCVFI